jgi:competence protein ComEA
MWGLFTKDERAVIVFLAASLALGSLILVARRVEPSFAPELAPEPEVTAASAESVAPAEVWPIDVNRAGVEELTRLPRIGPARAKAIVEERERRGGFGSLDELLDVRGIGPATLEDIRPWATVGERRPHAGSEGTLP